MGDSINKKGQDGRIRLRPHHLMCTQGYSGKGYSEDFVSGMDRIVKELREDIGAEVDITFASDDICSSCPSRRGGGSCKDDDKVLYYDKCVTDILGLREGTYSYHRLIRDFDKYLKEGRSDERLRAICESCQWYPISACARQMLRDQRVYSTRDCILALLIRSGDSYISGESMSHRIGVSRAAVNKAVRSLRDDGYHIDSVTNRGYRLMEQPDELTVGALLARLGPQRMERIECLDTIDSTNKYLMQLAESDAPSGYVVIAEEQTAGRARVGGSFDSPAGQGIYLSYLMRPRAGDKSAIGYGREIEIAGHIALAVLDAISEVCGITAEIRGVDDLYIGGRKVCGILTQGDTEVESGLIRALIVGIGINVRRHANDPSDGFTSLDEASGRINPRPALTAAIIRGLDALCADLPV